MSPDLWLLWAAVERGMFQAALAAAQQQLFAQMRLTAADVDALHNALTPQQHFALQMYKERAAQLGGRLPTQSEVEAWADKWAHNMADGMQLVLYESYARLRAQSWQASSKPCQRRWAVAPLLKGHKMLIEAAALPKPPK